MSYPQDYDLNAGQRALFKDGATRPKIVCLCGSTRFGAAFDRANLDETLKGHIVLSIGCVTTSDQDLGITPETKTMLDALHLKKIDLADEVLILNVGDYIGESTRKEWAHAIFQRKPVRFLEPHKEDLGPPDPPRLPFRIVA